MVRCNCGSYYEVMKKISDIKIVFFGTPEFAVASLDALLQAGADVAAVVTMPDKVGGRGHKMIYSDVKKYALGHDLPLLQPTNLKDEAFLAQLRAIGADLFIVIAFRMLPRQVWQMPPLGTFNLHASLLPKYRGAAPINRAVMNGDTKTGVTTFMLRHEIDTGDILSQSEVEILPDDNAGDVHDRLMALGAEEVVRTVSMIAGGTASPLPQPEGEHIGAPKIFREDCLIDWHRPAMEIHNQVRGLSPYPAAYCEVCINGADTPAPLKVFSTKIDYDHPRLAVGEIDCQAHSIHIGTADYPIEILSLQVAGKKRMDTASFLIGNRLDKTVLQ